MKMIPFNTTPYTGNEDQYVLDAIRSKKLSGDEKYTKLCHSWFEENYKCRKALLTPSCTHALEMAALLIDIKPGDEVIMPSYTFVSTANAFVLRGATIVFVDIRPDTMNIDEKLIEAAITSKTRAIVPVHYAGVPCEMDSIMEIAKKHNLYVIEDAAQAIHSHYKEKPLGTIGHLGTYSFHATKNISSGGEGGLLLVNDPKLEVRAEIIREKGTNRSQFFRGMVDKYSWVDIGSSYLASELQAAYLYGQLLSIREIISNRVNTWNTYYSLLVDICAKKNWELPPTRESHENNAHMFYLKFKNLEDRTKAMEVLKDNGVQSAFHYVPLHTSSYGKKVARFEGNDVYTTAESERLLRLPLWYGLDASGIEKVLLALSVI